MYKNVKDEERLEGVEGAGHTAKLSGAVFRNSFEKRDEKPTSMNLVSIYLNHLRLGSSCRITCPRATPSSNHNH